jgi:predicted NUDIX family NTP pyrophosphohydrolase
MNRGRRQAVAATFSPRQNRNEFRSGAENIADSVSVLFMMRPMISAGLLMFRTIDQTVEVLLVHPGGPYFRNKDEGAWTIAKGEVAQGEDLLTRAKIEFEEELGISAAAAAGIEGGNTTNWIEIGSVKQKGGKTVHAWAFEGGLPADFKLNSNTFELEWPPRSGKTQEFPEVDQASFFPLELARRKINPAQVVFLDRLLDAMDIPQTGGAE